MFRNSRFQIVFRTDIFRKVTFGAPVFLYPLSLKARTCGNLLPMRGYSIQRRRKPRYSCEVHVPNRIW